MTGADVVVYLDSAVCICGQEKRRGHAVCLRCWHLLPAPIAKGLVVTSRESKANDFEACIIGAAAELRRAGVSVHLLWLAGRTEHGGAVVSPDQGPRHDE